jgi:hypothetical protein
VSSRYDHHLGRHFMRKRSFGGRPRKPASEKKPEKRTEDLPGPLGTRWKLSRFSHGSPDCGCQHTSHKVALLVRQRLLTKGNA